MTKNNSNNDSKNSQNPPPNPTRATFTFDAFDPTKGKFSRWIERLEVDFGIYQIGVNSKKENLIHVLGQTAYDTLSDCVAPKKPMELTYNRIVTTLTNYYEPAPLEIVENFKFHSRKQLTSETIKQYVVELRRMAINCNFGDYLEPALRNQFVFGLKDSHIQARLLEERDLTLTKAEEIAISMELSRRGGDEMHTKIHPEVNLISQKTKKTKHSSNSSNKKTASTIKKRNCYRCGSEDHLANKCKYASATCTFCKKVGHLRKVCLSAKSNDKVQTHLIEELDSFEEICEIGAGSSTEKFWANLKVNEKIIKFEIDSGSSVSIMNINDKKSFFPELNLENNDKKLISFCGTQIKVFGKITVNLVQKGKLLELPLYIVDGNKHPLLGRDWMKSLEIDWNKIFSVNSINTFPDKTKLVQYLQSKYSRLFSKDMGKIEGIKAKLEIDPSAKPVFIKARSVPFAIKPLIEKEIGHLVENGALVRVECSRWATPIVAIPKANNRIRLCGDYKITINPYLIRNEFPLPTVEELFEDMAEGEEFTKLDLTEAYLQYEVEDESQEYLTLSTHIGLFRPTRLMYGAASGPSIFQRRLTDLLGDIPGVKVFIDDIKITGPTAEVHLQRLELVLERLQKLNMRVNWEKSEFFAEKIQYCGYIVDSQGIHKVQGKVQAIQEMPVPKNKDQVRSFAGLVNYYRRFFPNLSTVMYPINNLLKENVKFKWDDKCQKAFDAIKLQMQSNEFLVHYNPTLPVVLATDASPYGVGAVLSHIMPDNTERPIQYASQTLNETQQRYSQIDKEAYAIVFGVKKFYQFLYGRKFVLETDNLPVSQIFSPKKSLPTLTATRMQHYAIFLQSFNFDIRFRSTSKHANADAMSRLPLPQTSAYKCDEVDVIETQQISHLPITATELGTLTTEDKTVSKLIEGLKNGRTVDSKDRFSIDQTEFSLRGNCLLRGIRVYIPEKCRSKVLSELHTAHFGISRTKSLARGYVWWPHIDKDIETLVKNCNNCQMVQKNPPKVQVHHWQPATEPFQRIHVDFAGPFMNTYFLVIVDSYSKWLDVKIVNNITTTTTIKHLREFFSNFGIPSTLVSDRGVQFTSEEFQEFLNANGIVHKMGAPYHPETNGIAERNIQTIKAKLKSLCSNSSTLHSNLCNILLHYRKTIHPSTGKSPAVMVFNRQIKSRLDLMIPNNQKNFADETAKIRSLNVNDKIIARDYLDKENRWKNGFITEKLGKLHYMILLDDGRVWKRHIDQIRLAGEAVETNESGTLTRQPGDTSDFSFPSVVNTSNILQQNQTIVTSSGTTSETNQQNLRRSKRQIRKPARYTN